MPANIQALALSAKKKLESGEAIFEADAIRKAIKGNGIFNKNDIVRLMKAVGAQFAKNKREAQRAAETATRRRS